MHAWVGEESGGEGSLGASDSEQMPMEPGNTGSEASQHTGSDSESEEQSSGLDESGSLLGSSEEENLEDNPARTEGVHGCLPFVVGHLPPVMSDSKPSLIVLGARASSVGFTHLTVLIWRGRRGARRCEASGVRGGWPQRQG